MSVEEGPIMAKCFSQCDNCVLFAVAVGMLLVSFSFLFWPVSGMLHLLLNKA